MHHVAGVGDDGETPVRNVRKAPADPGEVVRGALAFGMMLIAAGFVVYFINHALKPAGWAAVPDDKVQSAA